MSMSENFLFCLDGPDEGGGAITEAIDNQSHKGSGRKQLLVCFSKAFRFFWDRLFLQKASELFSELLEERSTY